MLVNNLRELARHVSLHRQRLYRVGKAWCFEYDAAWYVELPLKVALFVHDLEKYLFLPWLWKYYGARGKNHKRSDALALWTRMNKVGAFIKKVALLPLPGKHLIDGIEHVIDVVDRHLDPVALEEFNLEKQRPITDFLHIANWELADELIIIWQEHTKDLQYENSK